MMRVQKNKNIDKITIYGFWKFSRKICLLIITQWITSKIIYTAGQKLIIKLIAHIAPIQIKTT